MPVADLLLDGMQLANTRYERWTNGWWITDVGVERYVVSTILETLHHKLPRRQVSVSELSFEHIIWWSGRYPRPGRPRANMNEGNRCDIVILSASGRPIHLVEVKRNWHEDNCLLDLSRIRDLLLECGPARDGSLRRGYLTFIIQSNGENAGQSLRNLNQDKDEIQEAIHRRFNPNGLQIEFHCGAKRRWPVRYKGEYGLDWFNSPICVELMTVG